jgi:hypothetical protein
MSRLALRFYELKGEEYVPSARRPPPARLAALEVEITRDLTRAKRHTPGDGWHYLPAPAEVGWNGRYWWGMPRTSEGAVLAAVAKLCEAHGLDFMALQREAYPDEEPYAPTEENCDDLARPVTVFDAHCLLSDLSDINYYSLRRVLQEHLARLRDCA